MGGLYDHRLRTYLWHAALERTESVFANVVFRKRQEGDLAYRFNRRENAELRQAPNTEATIGGEYEIERKEKDVHRSRTVHYEPSSRAPFYGAAVRLVAGPGPSNVPKNDTRSA